MIRYLATILLTVGIAAPAAWAEQPQNVEWEDLIPPRAALSDPFGDVPMRVRFEAAFVARVLADQQDGRIALYSPEHMQALSTMDRLRMEGFDADQLVRAVEERNQAIARRKLEINQALDGQVVRMPGYALPLRASDTGVTEFLLVPYVGACIHYPPPPPNQIVHARLDAPHEFEKRYETIWITGVLRAQSTKAALDYVDGSANVTTGWTMEVTHIGAFADDPTAQRDKGNFSRAVEGPRLKLSRTGTPHKLPETE